MCHVTELVCISQVPHKKESWETEESSLGRDIAQSSVLHCVVCCSVLQCVAVCCNVLQCVAAYEGVMGTRGEFARERHSTE